MLKNFWYAVEFSAAVTTQPKLVTLMGQRIALYRDRAGKLVALDDRCAHRGASLAGGWVEENCLRCPYHGWKYEATGLCTEIPANQPGVTISKRAHVKPYPVQEQNGFIWLYLEDPQTSLHNAHPEERIVLPDLSQFEAPEWYGSRDEFCWQAHYTRVIENNIDVSHPPFLHRKLGQRQNQDATIAPFKVEQLNDYSISVDLVAKIAKLKGIWQLLVPQQADGVSTRRHAAYLPNFTTLELNFGGLKLAFLMAHVPVSEEVTITKSIILRNFLKLPILDRSVNGFGRKLLREDEAVVKDQLPRSIDTDLSGDVLVASDNMIIAYRKMYRKHLHQEQKVLYLSPPQVR